MTIASWIADDGTTLALDGSQGVKIQRGVQGFDGPPIRNTIDQRIGDGAVRVNHRRPERPLQLPLWIDEDTITASEVIGLMQSGMFLATSGRHLRSVVYQDGFEGQWTVETGGVTGMSHRKFNLLMVALDPWWYDSIESAAITFGTGTAWNVAQPWNASLPWNGGAAQLVDVTGDAETPVRVVILADSALTEVRFLANGTGWVSTGIDAAAALTVDSRPGKRGPYIGSSLFGIAESPVDWGLLTERSQPFMLLPGENVLTFGYVGAAAPAASVWWEPRWLTS